jgi:hypothetical protein
MEQTHPPQNPKPYEQQRVVAAVRELVRESGYHVARLQVDIADSGKGQGGFDEAYSRSTHLYHLSCASLREIDADAEEFIARTYQPHVICHECWRPEFMHSSKCLYSFEQSLP